VQDAPAQRWHVTPAQKKIALYGGIVIILLLCALGYVQYLRSQAYTNTTNQALKMQQDIAALQAKRKANDPTAGWKTYRNTEYGFTLKYPVNLTYDIEDNVGVLREIVFSNDLYVFIGNAESVKQGEIDCAGAGECIPFKPLKDCLYPCFKEEDSPWATNKLTDFRNDAGITVEFGMDVNSSMFGMYNQILSTFKFTDPTDASTWKTYRNDQYGFEFKYPADWTYDGIATVYFGEIDPVTGKRIYSEGTGGFNINVVNDSINKVHLGVSNDCKGYQAVTNKSDPIFSDNPIALAGKNGWQVSCSSEYGGSYTITVLPLSETQTIRINSLYKSEIQLQILSTFKFIPLEKSRP